MFPNTSLLEFGDVETVYQRLIEPNIDHFVSQPFEDVCIEYMKYKNMRGELPFYFTQIGRWWNKNTEIDAIASDRLSENIISVECKYRKSKCNSMDLKKHREKNISELLDRKVLNVYHFYFSWSGFTDEAVSFAKEQGIELITGQDIMEISKSQN